jgi:hypothetical protein
MLQVPIFGGTFESQNAVVARHAGYLALNRDHGTVAELVAVIDLGAPVILLLDPNWLGIGQHDVVLVGYRVGPDGQVWELLIDNPARAEAERAAAPGEPGNQGLAVDSLSRTWTGVFTPVFADPARAAAWQAATGR